MKQIRVACIGATQPHAAGYLETLRLMPDVQIVAAYDIDEASRRAASESMGSEVPVYSAVEALLEETRPDAAIVTLPPKMVPDVVISAARRGCHLIVEKPFARTATEFLPALDAVETAGVAFWTGFLRRYSPVAQHIRSVIDDDLLGPLVSAQVTHMSRSVRQRGANQWVFDKEMAGGGMLHWLGGHWIDLLHMITGTDVEEVFAAFQYRCPEIDVEDGAAVTLMFGNGMIGSLTCAYVLDDTRDQVSVHLQGERGWVSWPGDGREVAIFSHDPRWRTAPKRTICLDPGSFAGYGGTMGEAHMSAFLASVRGEAPVGTGAREALQVLRVLDAAQESHRHGRRVACAKYGRIADPVR